MDIKEEASTKFSSTIDLGALAVSGTGSSLVVHCCALPLPLYQYSKSSRLLDSEVRLESNSTVTDSLEADAWLAKASAPRHRDGDSPWH